ncbi:hypothetical protein K8I85_01045 [bacterium]|nr:hypothetical protein [bacterium]
MRRLILLSLGAALVAAPGGVRADAELHGFVETAAGMRTAESNVIDDSDYTLRESRAQIRLNAYGDASEAFVRLDVFQDAVTTDTPELELREAFLRFTTAGGHLDVKGGRQALTWGTGDLVFINDLFPKDWESFFAGREDQYLKAPSDALRLGLYGLPFAVDAVFTPEFTPDRLPAPAERFSIPAMGPPPIMRPAVAENTETALRLSRNVGNFDTAFYGYRGFFKTPMGVRTDPTAVGLVPFYPELSVYGASVRGAALGGVAWVEGGYYDSRQDRDGNTPTVPNSSTRGMVGFERQLAEDFNATLQWYGEWMMKHADATTADPGTGDELRQILTLRLEKWMRYQTVRLSFFGFWSPTDEDYHLRPLVGYRISDEVELTLGANVFEGNDPMTTFAAFDRDDNVYARLRYGF